MRRAVLALGGILGALAFSGRRSVPPRRIVAVGDSITEPGLYLREVHRQLGTNGESFGRRGWGAKALRPVFLDAIDPAPDVVIIQAGVNDLASGRGPAAAVEGISQMYAWARASGVRVVVVPILPWSGYYSRRRDRDALARGTATLNGWLRSLTWPGLAVVDVRPLANGAALSRESDSGDGLHLNARGQRRLGGLIAATLRRL